MAAETVKIALNIAEGANEIKYCDPPSAISGFT